MEAFLQAFSQGIVMNISSVITLAGAPITLASQRDGSNQLPA